MGCRHIQYRQYSLDHECFGLKNTKIRLLKTLWYSVGLPNLQSEEESQSLLCSEIFISPTLTSDDCGPTPAAASITWQPSNLAHKPSSAIALTQENLHQHNINCNGTVTEATSQSGVKPESGYLLKAASLGDNNHKSEHEERDINSNFNSKCFINNRLKFRGNDVDSGWRMSGSNGYDRNRMTGSSTGSGNSNLSHITDGSGAQGHTQPLIASSEGMLLGRVGGAGGAGLNDHLNTRSIVAGTAGAGPPTQITNVFRSPHSVTDPQRYGQAYTTAAAGSSAVGSFSPLYSATHGSNLGPFSAFYGQYPASYSSSSVHGNLDPQLGTYSAVLQSIGNAAQSQVPRSPYSQGAGIIGQFSLPSTAPVAKGYSSGISLSTHEGEEMRYKREQVTDIHRRYSTSVITDDKSHQFSVPPIFAEPSRASVSSLRESPINKRELSSSGDFYKTPIGRGSLKHRILRPSESSSSYPSENSHCAFKTDEPLPKRTKTIDQSEIEKEPDQQMSESGLKYPNHFMKGSIIQLGNGELKRVEDLETDDFIHSADISSDLRIDSSTVVQISENEAQGTCILGFVVGEHKVQVKIEAPPEHPFFVFGRGWSSCQPGWTMKRYGLECHTLTVGDVCISLTHKEVDVHAAEISKQQNKIEGSSVYEKDIIQKSATSPKSKESRYQFMGQLSLNPGSSQPQGQGYRSDSGHNELSSAPVKTECSFSSPGSSQIPSSTSAQEHLPSPTP
ncbi:uncharacterized protein LOC128243000 [Mya arenaria]|uniref:uncharacterized protein LOC128242850 n=1 Tax=Mya arenaria TaxID=6604 RepID=UPI0022E0D0B1|nr:uncharacterized protein LOC128242850 [Mya arenaria]XP_052816432.1 uncharacterized protein LOC128243000 [Mya arenaria]